MIVDAHLHCSGRERCDDVLPACRFGTLHEAARPIRANGAAVKAAAAAQR
jgi:hypothetical protein